MELALAKIGLVKQISFIVSLILALNVVQTTTAAGPDDEFIRAYILISEGDNLAKSSQNKSAIQKYNQALNTLNTIKASNPNWKKGFYYIAVEAKVPICIAYVDYKNKKGGFHSVFNPSGNIDEDITKIKKVLSQFEGRYPEKGVHV